MSQTITVRLTQPIAEWLERTSSRTGLPQGRIIRDELDRARTASPDRPFMRIAGSVRGARDLSSRKGFAR